jgi:hypothetical protein
MFKNLVKTLLGLVVLALLSLVVAAIATYVQPWMIPIPLVIFACWLVGDIILD